MESANLDNTRSPASQDRKLPRGNRVNLLNQETIYLANKTFELFNTTN